LATDPVSTPIFVGRQDELDQFDKVLRDPGPRVALVVGQQGMGKTMLVERMMRAAENHPQLKCGAVRYKVAPTDSVDSVLELMLAHAYDAAAQTEGSFAPTERRRKQRQALSNVLVPVRILVELGRSLIHEPARDVRDRFLKRVELVSRRLPHNGRAVFVVDPEKYMAPNSDEAWAIVAGRLPPKVKLLFAQRPEDVLVNSQAFNTLENLVKIPGGGLEGLDQDAVDELIIARAPDTALPPDVLRDAVAPYKGHPYAVDAALRLIEAGTPPSDLPPDPDGIAEAQWTKACALDERAIALFEAYAVLEVGVPDEVAEAVSGLSSKTRRHLLANAFLKGLLRDEAEERRIYHAILADYIRKQIEPGEADEYHERAIETYRARLSAEIKPDGLAAQRLPEHVLATQGESAFVLCFIDECGELLRSLGLYDTCVAFTKRGLGMVGAGSIEEATLIGNLGLIYRDRGDLSGAESKHLEALAMHRQLGHDAGIAATYGNLGVIYGMRGAFDLAEDRHNKARAIYDKVGRPKGGADQCSSLGIVYRLRGEPDRAEQMHEEALAIYQRLGLPAGVAKEYSNLAAVWQARRNAEKAEELELQALAIHLKIGHPRGIAASYGNLGLIYRSQGDLERAESKHLEALKIVQELHCVDAIANQYGGLALVYGEKGDLEKAEDMQLKALALHEQVGHGPGVAADYQNLGLIYQAGGDTEEARTNWTKARDLYREMGMHHRARQMQGLLDSLGASDERAKTDD
jgi:tetratricopeptide (TPR) repeat protein